MGRPPTRPKKLRDGFYIEVRTKGARSGVKLRTDTLAAMKQSVIHYRKIKEVTVMGEYIKGKPAKKVKVA